MHGESLLYGFQHAGAVPTHVEPLGLLWQVVPGWHIVGVEQPGSPGGHPHGCPAHAPHTLLFRVWPPHPMAPTPSPQYMSVTSHASAPFVHASLPVAMNPAWQPLAWAVHAPPSMGFETHTPTPLASHAGTSQSGQLVGFAHAHTPPVHATPPCAAPQQSALVMHACPDELQHVPSAPHVPPPQQSMLSAHVPPTLEQHVPVLLSHVSPSQQGLVVVSQTAPGPLQATQLEPAQSSLVPVWQQSLFDAQLPPTMLQHAPLSQAESVPQQGLSALHPVSGTCLQA
jgi:hypothetical protein